MKDSYDAIAEEIASYVQKGYRLLLFAKQEADGILPLGLCDLIQSDPGKCEGNICLFCRAGRKDQSYLRRQSPVTVSEVAKECRYRRCRRLCGCNVRWTDEKALIWHAAERYTPYSARVTPDQKQSACQRHAEGRGHTVAMTGDGVNDVLALKDADCSVAMASGSDACCPGRHSSSSSSRILQRCQSGGMRRARRVVNNVESHRQPLPCVKNIFSLSDVGIFGDYFDGHLSAGAVTDLLDQYVYDRYSGIFAGIGAKPRSDQGTFYARGPSAGTSGRADGCSGSRCAGDLRAGLFPSVGRCCDSGDPAFVCGRLYDPDQDIQTDELASNMPL